MDKEINSCIVNIFSSMNVIILISISSYNSLIQITDVNGILHVLISNVEYTIGYSSYG